MRVRTLAWLKPLKVSLGPVGWLVASAARPSAWVAPSVWMAHRQARSVSAGRRFVRRLAWPGSRGGSPCSVLGGRGSVARPPVPGRPTRMDGLVAPLPLGSRVARPRGGRCGSVMRCGFRQRQEGQIGREVESATREERTSEGRSPRALPARNKAGRALGGTKHQEAVKAWRCSTVGCGKPGVGRFPLPQAS